MTDPQIPVESAEPKEPKKRGKLTYARPVFSSELLTDDARKRFDQLPGWQRHLIKRLIEHGDLPRAATESNVSTYVNKHVDEQKLTELTIVDALNKGGLTSDTLVHHLLDCLEARVIKFDRHQNPIHTVDLNVKLKTLELIMKLRGDFNPGKDPQKLDELFNDTPV